MDLPGSSVAACGDDAHVSSTRGGSKDRVAKGRITDDNLGAWLIKCQPEVNVEVSRAILDGETEPITRWCVATNYRSAMMKPGDRALLWISGDGRRLARGIWGTGQVTGVVRRMLDPAGDDTDKLEVPLHVGLLREGLSAERIKAAGVDLEVFRVPQGSNPSWVSKEQLSALDGLLQTKVTGLS